MPRAFSSGALSISSKAYALPPCFSVSTLVIAAVSVVLPWSMWPMVPTFTWGLFRSNFSLAMVAPTFLSGDQTDGVDGDLLASDPSDDLVGDRLRDLLVRVELHRVRGAALS